MRTPLPHFLFSSPTLRISPEFAVITRKWRYFKAQLSFIWILSSSLVLRRCWQIKFLVPKFWVKSCHCLMPTKERFIWSQFITISSLCRHVDAQAWEIHRKDKTWCWLFLSVKKVHRVEIWGLWGKCLITFKIIEKCAYQRKKCSLQLQAFHLYEQTLLIKLSNSGPVVNFIILKGYTYIYHTNLFI